MSSQTDRNDRPTDQRSPVDNDLYLRIKRFLFYEAELIDDREFSEWLELLADDITYQVPVRVSQESETRSDFTNMYHIDDNKFLLKQRVNRLETEYAWAEQPPSRTRHFVSNVRVSQSDRADEHEVRSNLLLYVSKGTSDDYTELSGERHDTVRETDDGFEIANRTVYLDNTTLPLDRISIFI